jgi:hypothetical protein
MLGSDNVKRDKEERKECELLFSQNSHALSLNSSNSAHYPTFDWSTQLSQNMLTP